MTGPDHYREAEVQAEAAARAIDDGRWEYAKLSLALGQLHATLANTAATAIATLHSAREFRAWREVLETGPKLNQTECGPCISEDKCACLLYDETDAAGED